MILTDNLLTIIPNDAFPKRGNIQNLNFRRNKISNIEDDAFASQEWVQLQIPWISIFLRIFKKISRKTSFRKTSCNFLDFFKTF